MTVSESKPCSFNQELPPPVALEYSSTSTWKEIGELKSYVTGPEISEKAVIVVFDIFGPSSQVLQRADRLADHMNAMVVVPDLFKGEAPDYDEYVNRGREALKHVLEKHADIKKNINVLLDLAPTLESQFPSVKSWGVFGLCWGGKLAVVASGIENNPFRASGQTHPSLLSVDDAKDLKAPHILMPSKDEPEDAIAGYDQILTEKQLGKVERFPTMFHGWMGARADLTKTLPSMSEAIVLQQNSLRNICRALLTPRGVELGDVETQFARLTEIV